MKIVYLNPVGALGGAERVLLAVLGAIRRQLPKAELSLIVGADGPLLERARALGVKTFLLPMERGLTELGDSERQGTSASQLDWVRRMLTALPTALGYGTQLRRLLGRLGPDLIHSNGLKMHLFARLARPAGVPVVWHLHDFYGLRPVVPLLIRLARRGLRGGLAVSAAVAQDARFLLPGLPVEVLFNTVDTDTFRPGCGDGPALDRLAGLLPAAAGVVRVGLVATYARWKGHELFLEAAARLVRDTAAPAARFYLVGGPIYGTRAQYTVESLRQRAQALGLGACVGFVPFQEDTAAVYQTLDVVVHASTQPEPFGLTVAEALACGRAVVVSQAGGVAELFTPGHDALGVSPGDVAALTSAIRRLAADPHERCRLGINARTTAVRLFHPARLGPQLAAFYARFLRRSFSAG